MEIPKTKYLFNDENIYEKWCLGLNLSFLDFWEIREGGLRDINRTGMTLVYVADDHARQPVFPNPIPLERSVNN